jgi:hypothetical protein
MPLLLPLRALRPPPPQRVTPTALTKCAKRDYPTYTLQLETARRGGGAELAYYIAELELPQKVVRAVGEWARVCGRLQWSLLQQSQQHARWPGVMRVHASWRRREGGAPTAAERARALRACRSVLP